MTASQFRAALKRLVLTQAQAANTLGVSLRTVNGYANGDPIPEPTTKLLRLMIRLKLTPDDVK